MKKQKFSSILTVGAVVALLAFVIFLIVQNRSFGKILHLAAQNVAQSEVKRQSAEERKQSAEAKNIVLESNVILAAQSSGRTINNDILLTNVNGNKHKVAEVFAGNTPCLVFQYALGGCSPCIDAAFEHLVRLKNSVDPSKLRVIIILNNTELRQMITESRLPNKNQFTFYKTVENGFELPIDEAFVSYLFIAERNKTNNVFVVDKMFLPLLKKYIDALIEIYR